jgi:hypothetical protein
MNPYNPYNEFTNKEIFSKIINSVSMNPELIKDIKFDYTVDGRVYEVRPDEFVKKILSPRTDGLDDGNFDFIVSIYDKKLNWYVMRVNYNILILTNSTKDHKVNYTISSNIIEYTSDDYGQYFIDTIGHYVQPCLPKDSDVIDLFKKIIELRNSGSSDTSEPDKEHKDEIHILLTKEDKAKILDEVGLLLDDIVYDKGYKDALKQRNIISKDKLNEFVSEIKEKSNTIYLVDKNIDFITIDVLLKIINKYFNI